MFCFLSLAVRPSSVLHTCHGVCPGSIYARKMCGSHWFRSLAWKLCCPSCFSARKNTDKFTEILNSRKGLKLYSTVPIMSNILLAIISIFFQKVFSLVVFFGAGLLSEKNLSWNWNCWLILRRDLTCEKFRCTLESCLLDMPLNT